MIVDSSGARVTDHVARPSSSDRAAPRCGRPARDVWAEIFALDHGKLTNGAAAQRLSTNMLGSVFQYFAEITGEKVTAAQARAVARGVSPHRRSRSGMCAARAACWWSSPRPRRSWCGRSGLATADHRHRRISHSRAGNDGGWVPHPEANLQRQREATRGRRRLPLRPPAPLAGSSVLAGRASRRRFGHDCPIPARANVRRWWLQGRVVSRCCRAGSWRACSAYGIPLDEPGSCGRSAAFCPDF